METSTEPMDPLTPGVAAMAAQPEGEYSASWRAHTGMRNPTSLRLRGKRSQANQMVALMFTVHLRRRNSMYHSRTIVWRS
jgi:hypothetical protein